MAVQTIEKTVGTTGVFSTPQLAEDGAPADLTTAEKSAAGTFLVAAFAQGESLTFVGSGATGKLLHTDSTGAGNGTYVIYGLVTGNPAASDVVTGDTSGATCVLSSGTPTDTGVIWQPQLQNQEFSGTGTQLTIAGGTTSVTTYKHFTTDTGASFRDHASVQSNALKYDATLGAAIRGTSASTITVDCQEGTARLSNLQITATGSNARGITTAGANQVFAFLIVEGTFTGTQANGGVFGGNGSGLSHDCLFIQRASGAEHIIGCGTGNPSFYNCTMVAPDDLATAPTAVFDGSGTVTVQNCGLFAGADVSTHIGSGTFNYTTCYGDDSTPATGITTVTYSSQFQNVNDATRDYRLVTGSDMKDTATTDATNAAVDIAGTARPSGSAYDGGCWEFVQAGTATYPGADGCGAW